MRLLKEQIPLTPAPSQGGEGVWRRGGKTCIGMLGLMGLLIACDPLSMEQQPLRKWELLSGEHATGWRAAGIPDEGEATVRDGEAILESGGPMTGLRFENWAAAGLPVRDYSITCEAMRVEGGDFFCAITFPVRGIDTCATLIVGGWGGGLVGISSIDGADAANNATRSEQRFENGQWYRLKLEVREESLKGWIDDRLVINTSIQGRTISLRPGYIEKCAPFGLASFGTTGRVRNLVVEEL